MWNFLSLQHTLIGHFVVYIFCGAVSGRSIIEIEEILRMICMVQGKSNVENNKSIHEVIAKLKKEGKGMTISDLVQWMHDHPMVTNPILHLYSNLQHRLFGVRFWNNIQKIRYEHEHMKPIRYIMDLADKLETEELIRLEERDQENAERAILNGPITKKPHVKKVRRGNLLELVRSGKYNDSTQAELNYEMAVAGKSRTNDNYLSKSQHGGSSGFKLEAVTERRIIMKKTRKKSLSKALSFVKGIGSAKSRKSTKQFEVKENGHRYNPKRNTSIKMAIDAIKSVTTDRVHKNKKKGKGKVAQEPGKEPPIVVAESGEGWKNAEKINQY